MSHSFNKTAIEAFGKENLNMPLESPNKYVPREWGELWTYIDIKLVKKWVSSYFPRKHTRRLLILDVGAGKGRMIRHFAEFAHRCVALEPFAEFYKVLALVSKPYENVETHNCTFSDYLACSTSRFDLIYVGGVTMYFDDGELNCFFCDAKRILAHSGLLCVRDRSSLGKTEYLPNIISRSREHMIGAARAAGLECIRWRRAYPPFFFDKLHELWPNKLTQALEMITTGRSFFPIWELLARMNLRHGRDKSSFVYLIRQNTSPLGSMSKGRTARSSGAP
jgi:SAM-dependent methyltransferase